ncbi:hypothetical protein KUTeg_024516 [Tegillarca granosa]|uniref:Dynein heavy chain tail domain-containing protein n=1 Tax=Tegillarca granosa TaxID=220873 RepID=A0ABQ9E3A4_TEGGR|nr:hypothetical protein KUTeg_024516 [Tegillarca granosa]
MPGDSRKDYILATTANHFGVPVSEGAITSLIDSPALNSFLDDGNAPILAGKFDTKGQRKKIIFANKIYAPLLLEDGKWSRNLDPKLQSLISELEAGLGSAIRKQDPSFKGRDKDGDNLGSILSPVDEFQYWDDLSKRDDRAATFVDLFKPISKDFGGLDAMALHDAMELVEITQDTLDDVWKCLDYDPYPEPRMKHLMDIIEEDLWTGHYGSVKESLRSAVAICERWVGVCETLTAQFWKNFRAHPWKGDRYIPDNLKKLATRLEEILTLRIVHEQQIGLLNSQEQKELRTNEAFTPFMGLNPLQYNPYTQPLWAAAVAQYDRIMSPVEQKIAGKLRSQFKGLDGYPQQMLREFQRYKELIKRPSISKEMVSERETLLGQLSVNIREVEDDFQKRTGQRPGGKGIPKGKNLPEIVNHIVFVRQLEARAEETIKTAETLLGDLAGFNKFRKEALELLEELRSWRRESFDDWARDMNERIDDPKEPLSLETNGRLMELNHKTGKLHVNYGDRLVTLLREVRQLGSMGFAVPAKIQHVANTAQKFYRHGVVLKQVAHFYNTIDQQMIASQQAMMLDSALSFERLVKNPKSGSKSKGENVEITWDNPEELDNYINKLQKAAERLTTENRRLRKSHNVVCEKVEQLISVDLLRQQQKWKDGLMDIRHLMANIVSQGFSIENMKPWRAHWDRQLYKALEHQYQMGIEALNENLPEIKVELTYRQQQLQFRPPFEEVKAKYFREMKRFISIPNHFKGVGEDTT